MLSRLLTKLDVKKDPDALLRLFVTSAVVSIIVIISLAGFGFRGVLKHYVVSNAEDDAVRVSRALLAEEKDKIVASEVDGTSHVYAGTDDMLRLDRHLRRFLTPFSIVKIKIYSADCRIVYSTEAKIIGEVNKDNTRLNRALAGEFDSKLEQKEEVHDLADEVKFNVDVVETYIPVRDHNKKVIGSFEIYQDVTHYWQQFGSAMFLFLGILTLILLLVFGLSFVLIKKGTRSIKEIQGKMREQAITDSLTGIFNKRQILIAAHKEFSRASRRREKGLPDVEAGFIMLDIDNFKEVNDRYGHLAGDQLIKEMTERISASLRILDAFGRFGGDEFLVIISSSNLDQTSEVAQKILALIREQPFTFEGHEVRVTASIGVSTSQKDDSEYVQALKRADDSLYRAKSDGRDQVAVASF